MSLFEKPIESGSDSMKCAGCRKDATDYVASAANVASIPDGSFGQCKDCGLVWCKSCAEGSFIVTCPKCREELMPDPTFWSRR